MNKMVVGFVAGAAVVGAAGYGTMVYPQARAKQEVDKAIAELPKEMQAKYQTLSYSLFSGKMVLGGLEVVVQDGADTITTKLATVTLRDLGKNHVGELRGSGLTLESADGSVRIEAEEIAGENMDSPNGVLAGMNSASTAVNVKRMALTGVSLAAADEKIKLREVVISDYVQTEKMPLAMTLGIHGMQIDPQSLPDQEARDGLAKLGYDKLSLNFDLSYAHTPETKRLSIKQAAIGGDGIGTLSFSLDLAGVEAAAIGDDPALALAAAQSATLESMELRYDDASLAGRLVKLAATEAGMDESQFKTMLLGQVAEAGAQAPDTQLTREAVGSATAFITNPKSLSLRMKPAQPLPLYQLMGGAEDPYALALALGVSVSANK